MKLSDQICKHAKAGINPLKPNKDYTGKTYKMSDGGGLYLEVTPKGSKLWRLKYRFLRQQKKLSIGIYPTITLADARNHRDEAKRMLANGIDPASAKQEAKQDALNEAANTFEVIAREWHELKTHEWSKVNAETTLKRLEKDVFPVIGKYPIKSITHKMLLDMAQTAKQRGAHELAKRLIGMCRHIYQHAIITGHAEKNIAEDLKGMIKSVPVKHYAAIEAKDIPKFIHDLESHRPRLKEQTYLAVKFMMLTFLRTSEMIGAEWDEFDFKEKMWLVPASRMKMKKEHFVPLSDQAIDILNQFRNLHNHPKFVFPSRNSHDNHMSNNTILMALKRMGYQGEMTGHGFRSLAMSTIMERLGYRKEVPDAQLAHAKKGDVARAYQRAEFLSDRIKMMQEWADYLDEVGGYSTVVVGKFGKV
ncbi:MAG: tyrosine-type recombinase/integrase [Alphaproteobacteria bacterium]